MAKFILVFSVILAALLLNTHEAKILVVPYEQSDCDCPDRAITTENMKWDTNDDGETILTGTLGFTKELRAPISVEASIEIKKKGKWQTHVNQKFDDVCKDLHDDDKPYAFLVSSFLNKELDCPVRVQSDLELKDILYDGDVHKFVNLTSNDVAPYRATITATATVDDDTKRVICINFGFEVVEVDD